MRTPRYDATSSIVQVLSVIVERYPGRVAVQQASGASLTYRQLWTQATYLATQLVDDGVQPGEAIALWASRDASWVIGQVGIMLAGAAFVPLDERDPVERTAVMVHTAGCRTVVAPGWTDRSRLPAGLRVVVIDDAPAPTDTSHEVAGRLLSLVRGDGLAYIMFTSGSTGNPKGVMVPHRGVTRLVLDNDYVAFGPEMRVLQTGAPTFDAATFEVWGPLLHGGRVLLDETPVFLSPATLRRAILDTGATTMWLTATLFGRLVREDPGCFANLRDLMVGGDVVHPEDAARVLAEAPDLRLVNGYGPTENTTFSTTHRVTLADTGGPIAIGHALANSTALVVGEDGIELAPGAIGELVVGGDGVALGYVDAPDETSRAFLPSLPGHPGPHYRTGDLATKDADGLVRFLGRADRQVKVRGYRIELDEVERVLLETVQHGSIVAGDDGGDRKVVAFVEAGRPVEEVRSELAARLPAYMLPSRIIALDELPLTAHGKVDRQALTHRAAEEADAAPVARATHTVGGAPAGDPVARAWMELMGCVDLAADTSAFDLGIDSLSAAVLADRVAEFTGADFTILDVIQHPTFGAQQRLVEKRLGARSTASPAKHAGPLSMTAPQRDLLSYQLMNSRSTRYNIPLLLDLDAGVDVVRLADAWDAVTARHGALSMVVRGDHQVPARAPVLTRLEQAPDPLIRPLAPQESLCRAETWVDPSSRRRMVFVDLHHSTVDGLSLRTIVRDWNEAYEGRPLRPTSQSYAEAVEALNAPATQDDVDFWRCTLEGYSGPGELPTDGSGSGWAGDTVALVLEPEETTALGRLCRAVGVTPGPVLGAVFALLLARLAGRPDICFGQPTLGRHRVSSDVVGMFVSTVPLRITVDDDLGFTALARHVAAAAADASDHGALSGSALVEAVFEHEDTPRALFDTLLAFQPRSLITGRLAGEPVDLAPLFPGDSMVDLAVQAYEGHDGVELVWEYRKSRFSRSTVSDLSSLFRSILVEAASRPDAALRDLASPAASQPAPAPVALVPTFDF